MQAIGLSFNSYTLTLKALYWSAILNGLVATPLMAVIMMMASNRNVMGKFVIPVRWVG
jgi:Mn2+/Fe2+ NRAMP family transporter